HRVEKSVVDALDSPLIYGNDIDKAKRILLNIYTSKEHPLLISEMNEIDQFMDALDPNIDVIWGVSNDNTLKGSAKVTILATGFEDYEDNEQIDTTNDNYFESLIEKLYKPYKRKIFDFGFKNEDEFTSVKANEDKLEIDNGSDEPYIENKLTDNEIQEEEEVTENSITFKISTENNTTSNITKPINTLPKNDIKGPDEIIYPHHKTSLLDKAKFLMGKITELTQDPE
ncbi:MAG: cell division protein FtsZ, partial [Prevotella sp.]